MLRKPVRSRKPPPPQPPDSSAAAGEVAVFLVTLFGNVDWAEEMMDFVLKRCPGPNPVF